MSSVALSLLTTPSHAAGSNDPLLVQRKCACGSSAHGLADECEECRSERLLGIQRKPVAARPGPRQGTGSGVLSTSLGAALRSPSQPLDGATRAFFEPRFGCDFSRVRIHTDAVAAESVRAVTALAYTAGQHVVFGGGQYAPHTPAGRRLLAHELAHTIQQRGGPAADAPQHATIAPPTAPLEHEADDAARRVASGESVRVRGRAPAGGVQRFSVTAEPAGGCGVCYGQAYGPRGLAIAGIRAHRIVQRAFRRRLLLGLVELPVRNPGDLENGRLDLAVPTPTGFQIGEIKPNNPGGELRGLADLEFYETAIRARYGRINPNITVERLRIAIPMGGMRMPDPLARAAGCVRQSIAVAMMQPGLFGYFCAPPFSVARASCTCRRRRRRRRRGERRRERPRTAERRPEAERRRPARERRRRPSRRRGARGAVGAANLGLGISIFSGGAGAANVGVGVAIMSEGVGVATVSAGVAYDSQGAAIGAVGAGAAVESQSAAAGAAGAGASRESATAGAGVAGAGTVEESTAAAAGVAGAGAAEGVTGAEAGMAGTGTARGGGRFGGRGGEGEEVGARPGPEPEGEAETGGEVGAPEPEGRAPEAARPGGAAATGGRGGEEGPGTAGTVAERRELAAIVARLHLDVPRRSPGEVQRLVTDAARLDALVRRATPTQVALLRMLAAREVSGVYAVPSPAWVEMILAATAGMSEEDLAALAELEWDPAQTNEEELREAIQAALRRRRAPPARPTPPPVTRPVETRGGPRETPRAPAAREERGGERAGAEERPTTERAERVRRPGARGRAAPLARLAPSRVRAALEAADWSNIAPGQVIVLPELRPALLLGRTTAGTRFGAMVSIETVTHRGLRSQIIGDSSAVVVIDPGQPGDALVIVPTEGGPARMTFFGEVPAGDVVDYEGTALRGVIVGQP